MRRFAFAALVAVTAVGIACSSFESDPGATSSDAGSDGSTAPPAPPPPPPPGDPDVVVPPAFCSTPQFSWSFDQGPNFLLGDNFQLYDPNRPPALTDAAASPPYALQAHTAADAGNNVSSMLKLDTGKPVAHLACELDVLVPDALVGAAGTADLVWAAPFTTRIKLVRDTNGNASLSIGGVGFSAEVPLGNVVVNQWSHVRFDTQWAADAGVLGTGQLGDAAPQSVTKADNSGTLGRLDQIGFGAYAFLAGEWTVRMDNIVCCWE